MGKYAYKTTEVEIEIEREDVDDYLRKVGKEEGLEIIEQIKEYFDLPRESAFAELSQFDFSNLENIIPVSMEESIKLDIFSKLFHSITPQDLENLAHSKGISL